MTRPLFLGLIFVHIAFHVSQGFGQGRLDYYQVSPRYFKVKPEGAVHIKGRSFSIRKDQKPEEAFFVIDKKEDFNQLGAVLIVNELKPDEKGTFVLNGHPYSIPHVAGGITAKVLVPVNSDHIHIGKNRIQYQANKGNGFEIFDALLMRTTEKTARVLGKTYRRIARGGLAGTIDDFDFVTGFDTNIRRKKIDAPDWAKQGKIRFWRAGFDPNNMDKTFGFIKQGRFNLVQIGWSSGLPPSLEKDKQKQAARFIKECHERGLRVKVYMKAASMYWKEMYEHLPDSKNWVRRDEDGEPYKYGGDAGYAHRYLVDPSKEGWQQYVLQNVKSALDAGADALYFDNNQASTRELMALFGRVRDLADKYGRKIPISSNSKGDLIIDGGWDMMKSEWFERKGIRNLGLMRLYYASGEGWKTARFKYERPITKGRVKSGRIYVLESGWRWPIAITSAFQSFFPLGGTGPEFLDALISGKGDPTIFKDWQDICQYNAFLEKNEKYFTDIKQISHIGMVVPPSITWEVDFLHSLAMENVIYNVIYLTRMTRELLSKYPVLVIPDVPWVTDDQYDLLKQYTDSGGKILTIGSEHRLCDLATTRSAIKRCSQIQQADKKSQLLEEFVHIAGEPVVQLYNAEKIVVNLVQKLNSEQIILHLVNYSDLPRSYVKVDLDLSGFLKNKIDADSVKCLSPDRVSTELKYLSSHQKTISFVIPEIDVYSIVVIGWK